METRTCYLLSQPSYGNVAYGVPIDVTNDGGPFSDAAAKKFYRHQNLTGTHRIAVRKNGGDELRIYEVGPQAEPPIVAKLVTL